MSSVSSPATSSTSPTSLPSAATTFQPARIINHETGSATSTVLPLALAHRSVGSNRALNSGVPNYSPNRKGSVSHFRHKATATGHGEDLERRGAADVSAFRREGVGWRSRRLLASNDVSGVSRRAVW